MKTLAATCLIAVLVTACGDKDGTDREENQNDTVGADVTKDTDVAGQVIAATVDGAVTDAAEEQDPADGAASFVDGTAEGTATRHRVCVEEGDTAVVDIVHSATRTLTFDQPKRSGEMNFSLYSNKHRVWSKDGSAVKCNVDGKSAQVPFADLKGVTLAVDFEHERSRSATFENKTSGKTWSRSFKHAAEGSRTITWTSVTTAESGNLLLEKSVSSTATRTLNIVNKDGEAKSLTGSIGSAEDAPMVILVERAAGTLAVVSRTIKSGKLVGVNKDGGRVETTFENVVYSSADGCSAASGTISGAIFAKDATEATKTFEIDHEAKTITFSSGESYEYSPEGCDLDDPETVTEADDDADVTRPE